MRGNASLQRVTDNKTFKYITFKGVVLFKIDFFDLYIII